MSTRKPDAATAATATAAAATAAAHERLFPGHLATLAITDPELIEYFGNCRRAQDGGRAVHRLPTFLSVLGSKLNPAPARSRR
ncbi:hypothetical protein ACIPLC_20490 [Kitasatospora sp. NPDC086801]|uniref:hypothetical protein n=1 Tax=Kitasatospora sp. NPDC086801 TaxID=3364066 RepID=UPI00382874EB